MSGSLTLHDHALKDDHKYSCGSYIDWKVTGNWSKIWNKSKIENIFPRESFRMPGSFLGMPKLVEILIKTSIKTVADINNGSKVSYCPELIFRYWTRRTELLYLQGIIFIGIEFAFLIHNKKMHKGYMIVKL